MDKQARLSLIGKESAKDRVYKLAANKLQKKAGLASEIAGSILWAPYVSGVGALGGLATGGVKSDKEMKEFNARSWSNVLIPGVGGYRLGRRIMTKDQIKNKEKK